MKKMLSLLCACLLLMGFALAERATLVAEDGTLYYGMISGGQPVGFVASRTESADRMFFGIMQENGWQGTLYNLVFDETGAFSRMIISNYAGGLCEAALHCYQDGTMTLFTYTEGEITGAIVRTGDDATAYTIAHGEASDPHAVPVDSLAGTALAADGIALAVQHLDDCSAYCVTTSSGAPFASITVYADGSVAARRDFDGEVLAYDAAANTCTIGQMIDGAWAPGALVITPDGSAARTE